MRRTLEWLLLAVSVLVAWRQYSAHKAQYRAAARALQQKVAPCWSPLEYSAGSIDPRFVLSQDELKGALREAEAAWEKAAGRDLFAYQAGSDLPVNVVYDQRQQSLDRLKELGLQTDQSLSAYEALKAGYGLRSAQLDEAQARLKGQVAAYKAREAAHNALVGRLNRRGGARPEEVRRVKAMKTALEREFAAIKKVEAAYSSDVETVNAIATRLNALIVQLNIDAAQYNREGAALGRYEEGVFRVSGGTRSIEVYAYTSRPQLVSLLAHEMGHALGLEHVEDRNALMYMANDGGGLKFAPADLAELDRACTPLWRRGRTAPSSQKR